MIEKLDAVGMFVRDIDEALAWYTETLGLETQIDETYDSHRFVIVGPTEQSGVGIWLQEVDSDTLGNESAERLLNEELTDEETLGPTWSFAVDDCQRTYERLRSRGVDFVSEPTERPYGIEARFHDLYGNPFVIVED